MTKKKKRRAVIGGYMGRVWSKDMIVKALKTSDETFPYKMKMKDDDVKVRITIQEL